MKRFLALILIGGLAWAGAAGCEREPAPDADGGPPGAPDGLDPAAPAPRDVAPNVGTDADLPRVAEGDDGPSLEAEPDVPLAEPESPLPEPRVPGLDEPLPPILPDGMRSLTAGGFVEETFLRASQEIGLAAESGGVVEAVHIDEGDVVDEGDALLELRHRTEDLALEAARMKAEDHLPVEQARLVMEQARHEAKIAKELYQEEVESELLVRQKELEADVRALQHAAAIKEQELAGLERRAAQAAVDRKVVRAPFRAIVTRVLKQPGEAVQPLETVAQLVVADPLHVVIHPPARMLGRFEEGQGIDVRVLDPRPRTVAARVEVVNEIVDAASRTFRVRLVLPNEKGELRPGVKVIVRVAGEEDE